jgi:hypothetical protein
MTKKDAEKLYSIMQRTEIFSMIACNLSGLVSFLRAKPEVYLDVEGLILLMHHYSARVCAHLYFFHLYSCISSLYEMSS